MERRLAAVLAADIVGYSRLMEADEIGVLKRQAEQYETVLAPAIAAHNGRVVKTTGDGFLAEFQSVVDAVNCAVAFQGALAAATADAADDTPAIRYRAGINIGDIILQGGDIFGDGVNVAARLEAIAPPGGLCISELVWQNLRGALGGEFQSIGPQQFKNINRPIGAWKWPADAGAARRSTAATAETTRKPRLTLTDFKCGAHDPGARDIAEGLITDLEVALSKLDTLDLVRAADPAQAADGYVLDGNMRTSKDRARCTVQLRQTGAAGTVWAERFDGVIDDVFEFQDHITEAVAGAVEIELSDGQQASRWRREAGDARAYGLFLEGRAAYKEYARPANARAKDLFGAALQAAPGFLSASVGLARTHIEDAHFGWSDDRQASLRTAQGILDGVLAVDPEHSAAHAEVSHLLMIEGDFPAGLLAAELAVAHDPNDADAHNCLSYLLNCVGRYDEALHVSRRAMALNPSGPEFYLLPMLQAYLALDRYSEAVGMADRILARRPAWLTTHVLKILALHRAGRVDEARTAMEEMQARNPRFGIASWIATLHNRDQHDIPDTIARLSSVGMAE